MTHYDAQRVKIFTAAQLVAQGIGLELATGGFTPEEIEQTKAMADDMMNHRNGRKPPALALTVTSWLKRRILLGITGLDSKKLAEHQLHKERSHG
jgi:hypothetical protein